MVRSCQVDSGVAAFLLERGPGGPEEAQVGLLLGAAGGRCYVLGVAATPSDEEGGAVTCGPGAAGASAAKGKGRGRDAAPEPSLTLDRRLIVEHAALVERMLPGGVWIVGAYLVSPHTNIQPVRQQLSDLAKDLRQRCPAPGLAVADVLLLHVSYQSRSFSLRVCTDGKYGPVDMKVGDVKVSPMEGALTCFKCRYQMQAKVPVGSPREEKENLGDKEGQGALAETSLQIPGDLCDLVLQLEKKRIGSSIATIAGSIPSEGAPVSSVDSEGIAVGVEFLSPFDGSDTQQHKQTLGLAEFHGVLEGIAYAHKRQPLDDALEMLRADLLGTLRSRLSMMEERRLDLDDTSHVQAGAEDTRGLPECKRYCLPRRVLFPWKCGIFLCDHLFANEDSMHLADNCLELLGWTVESLEEVVDDEKSPPEKPPRLWDPFAGDEQHDRADAVTTMPSTFTCGQLSLAIGAFALAAMVAAFWTSAEQ